MNPISTQLENLAIAEVLKSQYSSMLRVIEGSQQDLYSLNAVPFKKWSDHMKSVFNRVCVCLLLSLVPGISAGASAEIDRALDILLKDYDLDGYLM